LRHKHLSDNRSNLFQFVNSMPATKLKLLSVVLLFAVFNSQAMTLGRMSGAALVGQALDVVIRVQADPGETLSSQCFEADVFHGDTRQEPSRVQLNVEPTQTAQTFNVRISSSALVDEPVVTVYLRSLCSQKTSRRYVLLADVASDQLAPATPRVAQLPFVIPATASASTPADVAASVQSAPNVASVGTSAPTSIADATQARVRVRPAAAVKASKSALPARKKPRSKTAAPVASAPVVNERLQAGRSGGQSRLKLDPLEVLSERVTTLESTPAVAPAELAARDARDTQRLQTLETSVKNLLMVASRNEASLADMRVRLEQAQSERYKNPLVYGLIVFLLILLAALVFLLSRRSGRAGSGSPDWWNGSPSGLPTENVRESPSVIERTSGFSPLSAPAALAQSEAAQGVALQALRPEQEASPRSVQAPITQVDVSLVEMSESTFDRLMQSGTTHSAVRKPRFDEAGAPVTAANRKSINSEELFDIRQQAEFFVSLGQTDQAVRILENRISGSGESSPLAYLDLLKIFHSLGLRADFRQVREDFNLLFNARVPEFSNFNDEGKGLEEYPDMVAEITAAWGTPAVFAAIEVGVFRDQWKSQNEFLDLAAFRDLLVLHAVAQARAAEQDSSFETAPPGASYPALPTLGTYRPDPFAPASGVVSTNAPLPVIDGMPAVDIDLTDLPMQSANTPAKLGPANGTTPTSSIAGNLIDFDLTDSQIDASPKPAK
jgi:pilus assembly protein FimV